MTARRGAWTGIAAALAASTLALALAPRAVGSTPRFQVLTHNRDYVGLAVDAHGVLYGKSSTSNQKLYRSTDEGRTWRLLYSFPDATNYVIWHLTVLRSGALLMQTSSLGRWTVYRSADRGRSWTAVLRLPVKPGFYSGLGTRSIAEGGGYVWFGAYNTGPALVYKTLLYRSADDGRTWQAVNTGTGHRHIHGLLYNLADRTLYVFFGDSVGGGVYRSTDGGKTLQPLCTDNVCVTINAALAPGGSSMIFGEDGYTTQNFIVRLDLRTGEFSDVMPLPYDSFSTSVFRGVYLVGTSHEDGVPVVDPNLHLYASFDGGETFTSVFEKRIAYTTGNDSVLAQFAFPNGDVLVTVGGYGTFVGRFVGLTVP